MDEEGLGGAGVTAGNEWWFVVPSQSVRSSVSPTIFIVSSCVNNAPPLWSMSRGRLSASKVRDDDKRKTRQTLMWWSVNKPQTNDLSKWVFVRSFITILGTGHPSISFAGSGSGVAADVEKKEAVVWASDVHESFARGVFFYQHGKTNAGLFG